MFVTDDVSQEFNGWLNVEAPENMLVRLVTALTSQLPIAALNLGTPGEHRAEVRRTGQVERVGGRHRRVGGVLEVGAVVAQPQRAPPADVQQLAPIAILAPLKFQPLIVPVMATS